MRLKHALNNYFVHVNFTDYTEFDKPFINFFKEAMLFDFNYKSLFNLLILNLYLCGAFVFNFSYLNRLQLTSIAHLLTNFKTTGLLVSDVQSLLLLIARALLFVSLGTAWFIL